MATKGSYKAHFPNRILDRNYPLGVPKLWVKERINNYAHPAPLSKAEKYFFPALAKKFGKYEQDGPYLNEDYAPLFQRWLDTSEKSQMVEVAPLAKEEGYTERLGEIPVNADALTKYVTPSREHVPFNMVGKYVSMAETARQNYMNLLDSQEGQALFRFMGSRGYKPTSKPNKIAAGYLPDSAIAAISHGSDGTAFIFSKGALKKIANQAELHGVKYDNTLLNTLMHEMVHVYGIRSEKELEDLLTEFYSKMAEREFKGYHDGIPVSSRSEYRKWKNLAKISSSRARMVHVLYKEAMGMGMEGEDIDRYISERMEEMGDERYEAAEKSSSGRHVKDSRKESDKDTRDSEETLDDRVEAETSESAE